MLIVLQERTVKMTHVETNLSELELEVLDQEVINLHNLARRLEQDFGHTGQLSIDLRDCADRLNDILKRC